MWCLVCSHRGRLDIRFGALTTIIKSFPSGMAALADLRRRGTAVLRISQIAFAQKALGCGGSFFHTWPECTSDLVH